MKRSILCILTICLLIIAICCAYAANADENADCVFETGSDEFDGYLVKIDSSFSETAGLMSGEDDFLEPVTRDIYVTDDLRTVNELLESGAAVYAEPNYIAELFDNDGIGGHNNGGYYYDDNNALLQDDLPKDWAYYAMKAETAAAAGLDGSNVRIAVIDTGVNIGIELENADIESGCNYVSNNTDVTDNVGHGTAVIELMAAADNGIGVTGFARSAVYVPLKCFSGTYGSIAGIVKAIYDAVDTYDCDAINMSFGISSKSHTLEEAVKYAYDKGITMVSAAGNISRTAPNGTVHYPAAYDEVIGVGGVDSSLKVSDTSQQTEAVYVCAPGKGVYTGTAHSGSSGTSFAAPLVTAAAALMIQENENITNREIMDELRMYAEHLGTEGYNIQYGYGFVSVDRILGHVNFDIEVENRTAVLNAYTAAPEPEKVTVASYDSSGKMLSIQMFDVDGPGNYSFSALLPEDAYSVRSFVLNADGMPMADISEKKISEKDISDKKIDEESGNDIS